MRVAIGFFALVLSSFAGEAAADRGDFVFAEIDRLNPEQTEPMKIDARRLKLCKLAQDPWLFYRGTNHLYWADFTKNAKLTDGPEMKDHLQKFGNDKTRIWLQGDLHAENFGAYHNADGKVVYGLNDFDESLIADYQYDVWRMATSLVLVAIQNKNLNQDEQRQVVDRFARSYLEALESFKGNDNEKKLSVTDCNAAKPLKKFLEKIQSKRSRATMLEEETTLPISTGKLPEFDTENNNDKYRSLPDGEHKQQITEAVKAYRGTLVKPEIGDDGFFAIKDIVYRLGGTGGLNAERYYMLIEGESESHYDDRILDIKEQTAPTPLQFLPDNDKKMYETVANDNHAERHMVAYQALVASPDQLVGWMELPGEQPGQLGYFSVRERSPYKESFRILSEGNKEAKLEKLEDYLGMAEEWGQILAAAHARSDKDFNDSYIDYSFEEQVTEATENKKKEFADLTVKVAMEYADRVAQDQKLYEEHFKQKLNIQACPEV